MIYAYLAIGISIFTWTGLRIVDKNSEAIKQPYFWLGTLVSIIIWPVIVALVIYDIIRMILRKEIEL